MKHSLKILALLTLVTMQLSATIKLTKFTNNSNQEFNCRFDGGGCFKEAMENDGGVLIDGEGAVLSSKTGHLKIRFEDSGKSGFHRPHWKYNVWVDTETPNEITGENSFLFATIFYDGNGEFELSISEENHISLKAGFDVKDILYPWKATVFGRGSPYNTIKNIEYDSRGVYYFDKDGFTKQRWASFFYDNDDREEGQAWKTRTLGS